MEGIKVDMETKEKNYVVIRWTNERYLWGKKGIFIPPLGTFSVSLHHSGSAPS